MKSYWIETYGCQMNKAESESLALQLNQAGLIPAEEADQAELVILNTCSVRKTAEDRIWGRIGHFKHLKKKGILKKVAITGCMAERLKEELVKGGLKVDVVIGNFQKHKITSILEEAEGQARGVVHTEYEDYHFAGLHNNESFKAFIPIMHGCDNYCTYCIVPYVRGPETSRNHEEILEEIEKLEARGVREITLLGQNVNSYRYTGGGGNVGFGDLLEMIAGKVDKIRWVRFMTSHPKDLSDQVIRAVREHPVLCRHIHLPVQHGSDRILKAMGRKYTREHYLKLVEKMKAQIPDLSLTTDLMMGFPGEEEEDFQATLDLMKEIRFNDAFMYKYSPREGTKAWEMEDTVPEKEKLRRLDQVIRLQKETTRQEKLPRIGKVVTVLVEGPSKKQEDELLGRTERDEMIVFPGKKELIGNFLEVRIESLNGHTFKGTMTKGE